jgi:hypothetical protein
MFGAGTPSRIWKKFLDDSAKAMGWDKKDFPQRVKTGDAKSEYANGQAPAPPPVQEPTCALGFVGNCDNNGGGNNNGGQGNNNGGGNNGGDNGGGIFPGLPGNNNGGGGNGGDTGPGDGQQEGVVPEDPGQPDDGN